MVASMILLPVLLPETAVALPIRQQEMDKTKATQRKRKVWKPSVLESMEAFIDVQKVIQLFSMHACLLNMDW
jgi:hypothetical protein